MLRQIIVALAALLILILSVMWAFKIGKPKEMPKKPEKLPPQD
jgi:hypothetical protein